MGYDPTPEQQAAIDAFCKRGENVALEAGAGTGKTSTLKFLSAEVPDRADGSARTGVYMAYNASIAKEAARDFPANTTCKTGHGHTMGGMADWQRRRLFDMPRQTSRDVAIILRTRHAQIKDDVKLTDRQIASVAMETIERFARSGRDTLSARDVPERPRLTYGDGHEALAAVVLPYARKAWDDILSERGQIKWQFDYPRKTFQLDNRALPGDFLFLDEAQDSNGVTIAIVQQQQARGTRVVAVGDECQAINGWMGAVDAMGKFGGTRLQLSKSFRFGPAIAEEANKWLTMLDAKLRITGHDPVGSVVRSLRGEVPAAILCRKNATAINEAMNLAAGGTKVALVKTVGEQIVRLARAAQQLKEGRQTDHPELMGFESWGMVQEYVEHDHGGSDLKVFVELIDTHTPEVLIDVVGKFPAPGDHGVQCVVSTAHRSKGLEWDSVRIADDFADGADKDDHEPSREDLMLAYVAVTRAKKTLDLGGLSWINKRLGELAGPKVKHDPWEAKGPWKPGDPYRVLKSALGEQVRDMERGIGMRNGRLQDAG